MRGYRQNMISVRRAVPTDAPELLRLRAVMLAETGPKPEPGPWQDAALRTMAQRLAGSGDRFAAFVVDAPDRPGWLAACAVGLIESRLPAPHNPSGEFGYVLNVATDPGYRRRGYSRACMRAVLAWYERRGVSRVDLRASAAGEPLYRSLGFEHLPEPTLRWMPPTRSTRRGADFPAA